MCRLKGRELPPYPFTLPSITPQRQWWLPVAVWPARPFSMPINRMCQAFPHEKDPAGSALIGLAPFVSVN